MLLPMGRKTNSGENWDMANNIIPVAEWLEDGARRFGADWMAWKFQCPVCKNIQTPSDVKALGTDPQEAYQECIGRKLPKDRRATDLASEPAAANGQKSPCDYAAFGLFRLGLLVQGEHSGKPTPVFPFAEVPDAPR